MVGTDRLASVPLNLPVELESGELHTDLVCVFARFGLSSSDGGLYQWNSDRHDLD